MVIMLVDDLKKHRIAGLDQLKGAGHDVFTFSSYERAAIRAADGIPCDVALIDLLMPAEGMTLGEEGLRYLGQPLDVGFSLAMKLALHGVERIAVVTDMNHHHHPSSAIMDWFLGKTLDICGSKVRFMHARMTDEGAKDWLAALDELLK
jgi:CheY-like chemotaxis protein